MKELAHINTSPIKHKASRIHLVTLQATEQTKNIPSSLTTTHANLLQPIPGTSTLTASFLINANYTQYRKYDLNRIQFLKHTLSNHFYQYRFQI